MKNYFNLLLQLLHSCFHLDEGSTLYKLMDTFKRGNLESI